MKEKDALGSRPPPNWQIGILLEARDAGGTRGRRSLEGSFSK